jgi:hypothetical protein
MTMIMLYRNTRVQNRDRGSVWELEGDDRKILNRADELYGNYKSTLKDINNKRTEEESKFLAPKLSEYISASGTLNPDNKEDIGIAMSIIADATNPATGFIDVDKKKQYNIETINSWLKDPQEKLVTHLRLSKNYDGSGKLTVEHNKDIYTIPLSADKFKSYYPNYSGLSWLSQVKSDLKQSNNTTNTNVVGDPVHATFTGDDLPLINGTDYASKVRVDIEGDVDNNGSENDLYQIRLYVHDGNTWHDAIINQKGYLPEGELERKFKAIGMDAVKYVLEH